MTISIPLGWLEFIAFMILLAALLYFSWLSMTQRRYICRLEQRVRTLTLRVWQAGDPLTLGRSFVPVYMTDDTEPEHFHGVIAKESK